MEAPARDPQAREPEERLAGFVTENVPGPGVEPVFWPANARHIKQASRRPSSASCPRPATSASSRRTARRSPAPCPRSPPRPPPNASRARCAKWPSRAQQPAPRPQRPMARASPRPTRTPARTCARQSLPGSRIAYKQR